MAATTTVTEFENFVAGADGAGVGLGVGGEDGCGFTETIDELGSKSNPAPLFNK